jgi:hypothetical protein
VAVVEYAAAGLLFLFLLEQFWPFVIPGWFKCGLFFGVSAAAYYIPAPWITIIAGAGVLGLAWRLLYPGDPRNYTREELTRRAQFSTTRTPRTMRNRKAEPPVTPVSKIGKRVPPM